jgi:Carboxypeptidase regulatory-like domain
MLQTAKRLATLFALFLALTPALVFGQASFEAQVRGVVNDATGSVIIGAKVTITDVATNISSSTATDERGYYIFNGLRPTTYNLKAEMAGFRAEEVKDVVLTVSQRANIDLTLNVAGLEQQMTVVEAAPTLDTGNAEIGTTVTGQYTREMPLYGRSYYGLVFLSGGITRQWHAR